MACFCFPTLGFFCGFLFFLGGVHLFHYFISMSLTHLFHYRYLLFPFLSLFLFFFWGGGGGGGVGGWVRGGGAMIYK